MRTYIIAPILHVSFKGVSSAYIGAFGVLWLFVEPMGTFGLIPQLDRTSGIVTYIILLLVPALLIPMFLHGYRWYKIHNLPLIALSVRSASDGVTYSLRVAENMQVGEVMMQFMDILLQGPSRDRVQSYLYRYHPVLQVYRADKYVDVDSNLTVHAAGLCDKDECQVRAQLHNHFNEVRFSKVFSRDRYDS